MAGATKQLQLVLLAVAVAAAAAVGVRATLFLETRYFANSNCTGTVETIVVEEMGACLPNGQSGAYAYMACALGNSTSLLYTCQDAACTNCTLNRADTIDACSTAQRLRTTCVDASRVTPFGSIDDGLWRANYVTNYTLGCNNIANRTSYQYNRLGFHYSNNDIVGCNASVGWQLHCTNANCSTYITDILPVNECEDFEGALFLSAKRTCLLATSDAGLPAARRVRLDWAAALATAALLLVVAACF